MDSRCKAFVKPSRSLCVSTFHDGIHSPQRLPHLWAAPTGGVSFLTSDPTLSHPGTHPACWGALPHESPFHRVSKPKSLLNPLCRCNFRSKKSLYSLLRCNSKTEKEETPLTSPPQASTNLLNGSVELSPFFRA